MIRQMAVNPADIPLLNKLGEQIMAQPETKHTDLVKFTFNGEERTYHVSVHCENNRMVVSAEEQSSFQKEIRALLEHPQETRFRDSVERQAIIDVSRPHIYWPPTPAEPKK